MMLDRRTFLGTALVATGAAAIANFLSLSSKVQTHTLPPEPSKTELAAGGVDVNCVAFKIDGWDRCDDIPIGGSKIASADLLTRDLAGDHVLIKINQSWRATWR